MRIVIDTDELWSHAKSLFDNVEATRSLKSVLSPSSSSSSTWSERLSSASSSSLLIASTVLYLLFTLLYLAITSCKPRNPSSSSSSTTSSSSATFQRSSKKSSSSTSSSSSSSSSTTSSSGSSVKDGTEPDWDHIPTASSPPLVKMPTLKPVPRIAASVSIPNATLAHGAPSISQAPSGAFSATRSLETSSTSSQPHLSPNSSSLTLPSNSLPGTPRAQSAPLPPKHGGVATAGVKGVNAGGRGLATEGGGSSVFSGKGMGGNGGSGGSGGSGGGDSIGSGGAGGSGANATSSSSTPALGSRPSTATPRRLSTTAPPSFPNSPSIVEGRSGLRLKRADSIVKRKFQEHEWKRDWSESQGADVTLPPNVDNIDLPNAELQFTERSAHYTLTWDRRPGTALLVKKWKDPTVTMYLDTIATWLKEEQGMRVLVEPHVAEELNHMEVYDHESSSATVDFIVCLGGDGTLIHVTELFPKAIPPVFSIHMGSLGFLTPFQYEHFKRDLDQIMTESCAITIRTRFHAYIVRSGCTEPSERFSVLNDVVIDRGSEPYLSNLECWCDDKWITRVQADGIIIATATGSTAYSLSAGGSIVHPTVPGILFTPICPHSLSFRPLIFPDSVVLKLMVPRDARCNAWAAFDGRSRCELRKGDAIFVKVSKYPVASINKKDQTSDWFKSLARCLHWNRRTKQGADNNRKAGDKKGLPRPSPRNSATGSAPSLSRTPSWSNGGQSWPQ